MISVREIRLPDGEGYALPAGATGNGLALRCLISEALGPATLLVERNGALVAEVPEFVPLAVKATKCVGSKVEGCLDSVVAGGDDGFALLVGDQGIIRVGFREAQVRYVCCLNRGVEDDRGFYTLRCEVLDEAVLVIYEGGAMRIRMTGDLLWHVHLYYDDVFVRRDGKWLFYATEFGPFAPDGFVIDMETGERSQR
jgi:hypothetical protein